MTVLLIVCVWLAQWLACVTDTVVIPAMAPHAPLAGCAQRPCCCPAEMVARGACCCAAHAAKTPNSLMEKIVRSSQCAGKTESATSSTVKFDWTVARVDALIWTVEIGTPVDVRASIVPNRTQQPPVPPPRFLLAA